MGEERKGEKQGQGFTVSDRRKRYEPEAPERPAAPAEPAAQPAPEPESATAPAEDRAGGEGPHEQGGTIGPADFVQLVGKLFDEALLFMGYHDDPKGGQSLKNLPVASWHVDILEVLKAKTKGNLDAEEEKILDEAVRNLKGLFVRASGFFKH